MAVNDRDIRDAYHRQRLARQHRDPSTLVVDELGLRHGACRADIAVIGGHFVGIEIKSDADSLDRLASQVNSYSAVFDRAVLVSTERHLARATEHVPPWWGIVSAKQGPRGGIRFATVRRSAPNPQVDQHAVAQLLWRDEAAQILSGLGFGARNLRGSRAVLYGRLVDQLSERELRKHVSETMKRRSGWREPAQPSQGAG